MLEGHWSGDQSVYQVGVRSGFCLQRFIGCWFHTHTHTHTYKHTHTQAHTYLSSCYEIPLTHFDHVQKITSCSLRSYSFLCILLLSHSLSPLCISLSLSLLHSTVWVKGRGLLCFPLLVLPPLLSNNQSAKYFWTKCSANRTNGALELGCLCCYWRMEEKHLEV